MSREEYLKQLAYLLQDIPDNERDEAVEFYRDYFEEAGEGQEADVIATLGSPEKVAAQIKNGLKTEDGNAGEYTDSGYLDERFREDNKVPASREAEPGKQERDQQTWNTQESAGRQNQTGREENRQSEQQSWSSQGTYQQSDRQGFGGQSGYGYQDSRQDPVRRRGGLNIGLIVVICIIASPIILSVLGVAFGAVMAVLGSIFAVAIAAIGLTFAALICGAVLIGVGIANMVTVPAVGCVILGGGLVSMAVGILLILAAIGVLGRFVPWAIRGVTGVFSRLFRRGGRRS